MSDFAEMKKFFAIVKSDVTLQKRLFATNKIGDVAETAKERMLYLSGGHSANLSRPCDSSWQSEQEILAAAKKPKTGAQWGRNGLGYLDAAGFGINQFLQWDVLPPANEPELENFLLCAGDDDDLRNRLIKAQSYNDVAQLAKAEGFEFFPLLLLKFMASQVLRVEDKFVEKLVEGADSD